jgi:hypothetical protein
MIKNKLIAFLGLALIVQACGGEEKVEIGNKTSM